MRTVQVLGMVLCAACASSAGRPGSGGMGGNGGNGGGGGSGGGGPPMTVDVVAPGLPPGIVGGFDGAPPATSGLQLVYPNSGAIIPHDLSPIDVQWNGAVPVYRVTFAVETGDRLRGYVTKTDWIPPASNWQWLLDRAAGHTISLSVEGGTFDANGMPTGTLVGSAGQPLHVSIDDATGALFYFATTGDQLTGNGTLERLQLGATQPDKYLNKTNDGNHCLGCHTLTRDGKRLAFSFLDVGPLGGVYALGDVDATDPTKQQAVANTPVTSSSFNPDGTKLVTSYQGKLQLRDGVTGAMIANITTSGPALYPDWSPDGNHLVFVRPRALCSPNNYNFGQDSIFVYGGSLVTMDWNGSGFTNEQVILAAKTGENNYYPSYSPDGSYIAFARSDDTTKSTWGLGNISCNGADGSGLSYDNPSAMVWLLPTAAGAAPFALSAANEGPMHTNSWPKWGPKSDGEYLWISFSSTRPYGNVLTGANAHHQIWISAIKKPGASGDASAPAAWFPFQDLMTKNHIGVWSVKVGSYTIPG